ATGVLNFFRSLGSAVLVPVFSAVFIATAVRGSHLVSVQTAIVEGTRDGVDFAHVFTGVFVAAAITIAIGFVFMTAMKVVPLRGELDMAE
ncbi:MAG: MFS transporter, partial [Gammaproteobacteria bacterium]|nr:MFS transporter [Gammaproteobacteria bacterium]